MWRWLTRRREYAYITYDYESPFGGRLPVELEVGQKIDLCFTPEVCKFLAQGYTHIGVQSTLGMHWGERRDMTKANQEFAQKAWLKAVNPPK
jgi:hypothetical protein